MRALARTAVRVAWRGKMPAVGSATRSPRTREIRFDGTGTHSLRATLRASAGVARAARESAVSALPTAADIGIVGVGAMGAGIAEVAARAGHRVRLFDNRIGAADAAKPSLAAALRERVARGKLAADAAEAAIERLVPVHALGDLVSVALVIEAIVEDLDAKRKLLRELEVVVAPTAILASNTSSFPITALAAGMKHPRRIVGMHFFNPAPVMPLVEVVSGLATDPAIAAAVHATAAAWGKVAVHAASTPGFIVNRCARPFYGEALRLAAERAASVATIDAVMREAGGFRMGPFELIDLIGLDVNFTVTRSIWDACFHDPRYAPSVLQRELVAAGYCGRKSGRGFYDYTPGAAPAAPHTEPTHPAPARVTVAGRDRRTDALASRLAGAGLALVHAPMITKLGVACLVVDDAWLVPSDGRTATAMAAASGHPDCVVFDLAFDYATCTRLAAARADTCSDAGWAGAVGALQTADIAVSRLDDVAGLAVMRTVASLVNEAADAVVQGIATAADVDLALRHGVNYPCGPLAWGDALGLPHVAAILRHLEAHYGDPRYRSSPLIARRVAAGGRLAG